MDTSYLNEELGVNQISNVSYALLS